MTALLYLIQIYRVVDRFKGSGFRVVAAASPQIVMGRFAPVLLVFPIGEGGPRQRRSGALVNCLLEMLFPTYLSYR